MRRGPLEQPSNVFALTQTAKMKLHRMNYNGEQSIQSTTPNWVGETERQQHSKSPHLGRTHTWDYTTTKHDRKGRTLLHQIIQIQENNGISYCLCISPDGKSAGRGAVPLGGTILCNSKAAIGFRHSMRCKTLQQHHWSQQHWKNCVTMTVLPFLSSVHDAPQSNKS